MKTSSAKQKGRRACQEVMNLLLYCEPTLKPDDILVTSSGAPGRDILLSPKAQEFYPFAIEVKNVEKLNVREALEQAKTHVRGDEIPILFHTKNRSEMLVTLTAKDFLQLVVGNQALECGKRPIQTGILGLPSEDQEAGHSV